VLTVAVIFVLLGVNGVELHRIMCYYEVTPNFVIHSKGLLKKDIKRIFMGTVSDLILKQNIWQRMLNYGTVGIHRYTEGAIIEVKNINNPSVFMEVLQDRLNARRNEG
jgi:hypothetical protein